MAEFNVAFDITMGHEGGYSNDEYDAGGETYMGISRRYNPGWAGWGFVDAEEWVSASLMTRDFYKIHYWNKFLGDLITNQDVANEMFDVAVNLGVHRAVKFLQQALNVLNRNATLFSDLVVDGIIGDKTLVALGAYLGGDSPIHILKIINVLQGAHYINYCKKSPTQERFLRGWLKRVCI